MDRLGNATKSYSGSGGVYTSGSQPTLSSSYMTGQYMYNQNYAHAPYAGPGVQPTYHNQQQQLQQQQQQQQQYHTNYGHQPQSYGQVVQGYGGQSGQNIYQQNSCHKKSSVRNGDVMKRCRLQAA